MERDDLSFLEPIFQKSLNEIEEHLLIVNQSRTKKVESKLENIRVINDVNYGLSRSRNLAIQNSIKPIVWLLDDDCEVLESAFSTIINIVNKRPFFAAWTFRIKTFYNEPKRFYKSKSFTYQIKDLQHGPASIEIVLNRELVIQKNLYFDERFGLGAQFPMGEEFVFFDDLLNSGLEALYIPEYIVKHESKSSGSDPTSDPFIYTKGALAARRGVLRASYLNFKYTFFLWRKGLVKNLRMLFHKHKTFERGANDYWSGFEGHRIQQKN